MNWIDVNNQLPDLYEFVLVFADNQGSNEPKPVSLARLLPGKMNWQFMCEYNDTSGGGVYQDIEWPMEVEDITHWMPIPSFCAPLKRGGKMIIFDLDGTLADCEHRSHFVDPVKAGMMEWVCIGSGKKRFGSGYKDGLFQEWKPDWKSFYEACDKDIPINPVIEIFINLWDSYKKKIQIWSGRCESVRSKTQDWLSSYGLPVGSYLKMRPLGDSTTDDVLKERWLDEILSQGEKIDFVFDDRPKAVRMWRRRGIFVFNCCQHDKEF